MDNLCCIRVGKPQSEAELRAVSTGSQVRDAERGRGCAENSARRRHAVEHREDFQLGLEFVGDEVDGKVGVAHGLFDSGGEAQCTCECFGQENMMRAA